MKWSGAHIWDRSTRPVFWSTESVNHTLSGSLPWPPKAVTSVTGTPDTVPVPTTWASSNGWKGYQLKYGTGARVPLDLSRHGAPTLVFTYSELPSHSDCCTP